jgi:hypothetical protein
MEAFMIIGRSLKLPGLHLWKIMTSRLETELLSIHCLVTVPSSQVGHAAKVRGLQLVDRR